MEAFKNNIYRFNLCPKTSIKLFNSNHHFARVSVLVAFEFCSLCCCQSKMFDFFFLGSGDNSTHLSTLNPPTTTTNFACTYTLRVNEATLCTNPFVFTPTFPLNNVPKPNPQASSTNLGHLLAANPSAAKRPTQATKSLQTGTPRVFFFCFSKAEQSPGSASTRTIACSWPFTGPTYSISPLPSLRPTFSGTRDRSSGCVVMGDASLHLPSLSAAHLTL